MGFGDLKSNAGLKVLNEFLADKSFIQGFVPSQADVAVFEAMSGAPAESFVNALRWYNQIKSYGNQKSSLPGVKGTVDSYGPAGAAPAASKDDDDDDFDLFGEDEDEEDEEEAQRIKDERIAAYQAKKSKKPALIAKSNVILDVKP
ncbi:hypothetical protein CAPTEDRAFT_119820, partial [Capitella teleta]